MLIKDYKVHLSCFDSFKNIKTNDSNFSMIFQEIIDNFPFKPPESWSTWGNFQNTIYYWRRIWVYHAEAEIETGKSTIAATLAKIYYSSFILTMTKQLQEECLTDFKEGGFVVVK